MTYKVAYRNCKHSDIILLNEDDCKKVKDYKEDMAKVLSILPEYILLKHKDEILEDHFYLRDYKLTENSVITLYIVLSVHDISNHCHRLLMECYDSVRDLRLKYCATVKVADIILTNGGGQCHENHRLKDFLFVPNVVFTAFAAVTVTVVNDNGLVCDIESFENDTIKTIRNNLVQRGFLGNRHAVLMLAPGDTVLNDDWPLCKYGPMDPFSVFVGFVVSVFYGEDKGSINIDVNVSTTVATVALLVAQTLGTATELVTLMRGALPLSNDCTIGFYRITEGERLWAEVKVKILVASDNGGSVTEHIVTREQRIGGIKEELSTKNGIDCRRIVLSMDHRQLEDEWTVESLKIDGDSGAIMTMTVI